MVSVTTTVKYSVPDWQYCNHSKGCRPTKDLCRFCVKTGKSYTCALYNMPLSVSEGIMIHKDRDCVRATVGFPSKVEEPEVPQVDPKTVMKLSIKEYRKAYQAFIKQGYPDAMADKLAQQVTIGG